MDYRSLFDASPNAYMVLDGELRFVGANPAYLRLTASRIEDLLGRNLFEVFPHDPGDPNNESARILRESIERTRRTGQRDHLALIRYRVPRETEAGVVVEERFWSATHTPILGSGGQVEYVLQHTMDVTELERLRAAVSAPSAARQQLEASVLERAQSVQATNLTLAAERQRLRLLFEQAPGFMCVLRGPEHVVEIANGAYLELIGGRAIVGRPVREALPEVRGQGFFELLDGVRTTGRPFVGAGMRIELRRAAGGGMEERFVDFLYQPVIEADGTVSGIFVQGHDVTEQHRAQREVARYREHLEDLVAERTAALERSELERREAEAALRQSQKMEAVGNLTGGVAHDFNNLLQVIAGNLTLLAEDVVVDERSRQRLRQAIDAVGRGSKLSAQLLAFARRQPLEPVVLDLGRLVREMEDLLQRALGEAIELETRTASDRWNAFVDRNQLENVLLNLAINARDAMAGAGRLTLDVSNLVLDEERSALEAVAPGEYVRFAVSDTGCGMAPEVLERAFEPFFTTKDEGHGTGLGLSMVYGFVRQSGGCVRIESAPGQGTTLEILLPRSLDTEARQDAPLAQPMRGGSETVLVVEDDPAVRATVADLLGGLGYLVIEAADGQSAMAIVESGTPIDLLFTDVVMPGPLSSVDLARRAKERAPDLEVLFTSGYTDGALVHEGRLEPGVRLLRKPYRREELASQVRDILDTRSRRIGAGPRGPRSGVRILVVDDDDDTRETLVELLAELGHEPRSASCAQDAWALLEERAFDLLLTDVKLPGTSGLELARTALRAHPGLRVVIASGLGAAALDDDGALAGAPVLCKPFFPEQIEDALRTAMAVP